MVVGGRGDEVPIHGPVVVFAEGEAVGGVIVAGYGEGNEMGGVDEGDVVAGGEFDAEAAGGALVIVDGEEDLASSGRSELGRRAAPQPYPLRKVGTIPLWSSVVPLKILSYALRANASKFLIP